MRKIPSIEASPIRRSEPLSVEVLQSRISELPGEHRLVLALFYLERLSLEQIGRLLEVPERDVAAAFFLAHEATGLFASRCENALAEGAA